MSRILIAFLFIVSTQTQAQRFVLQESIPVSAYGRTLQLPWSGGINYPQWSEIDFNRDDKPDLFMFDRSNNRVMTFLNEGVVGIPSFRYAPEYAKMFPVLNGWAYLYDYSCDGLPDLFTVNSSNNGIAQYKASYNTMTGWNFTLVTTSILTQYSSGNIYNIIASGFLTPNFDDIDGDGDMDIVGHPASLCFGTYAYYRNMSMENFGVCDSINKFVWVTDSWGGFGICGGSYDIVTACACGISCNAPLTGEPDFSNYKPKWDPTEAAGKDDTYSNIFTIDLDGDGDKDILLGDSQCFNVLRLFNAGTPANAIIECSTQDSLFPSYDTPAMLRHFTNCAYIDVDNDNVKDLLIGNREFDNNKGVLFYKNTGTNPVPVFSFQNDSLIQSEMIDVGEGATAVFFDADSDGLMDIIIGNVLQTYDSLWKSGLTLYRNTGTAASPAFEFVTKDYANLSAYALVGPLFPAFADLDGDGDSDMVVGNNTGQLAYFRNIAASPGLPAVFQLQAPKYMNIDIGLASTPVFYDLNKDGKLDLIIGEKSGLLNYFENIGNTAALFDSIPTIETFGNIFARDTNYVDGYSVPFFFNDSGTTKLLVADMRGYIILYDNIDGNLSGSFNRVDTLMQKDFGYRYGYSQSVSGADLNNDGQTDLIIGLYGGGVQIYYRDDFNSVVSPGDGNFTFRIYPNPVNNLLNLAVNSQQKGRIYIIEVFNFFGQKVFSTLSSSHSTLDVSSFANGVYLVRVSTENSSLVSKFIVSH